MPKETLEIDLEASASRSFTTIKLGDGGEWKVPFGFGAAYVRELRTARDNRMSDANTLKEILGLIGYEVEARVVHGWSLRRRVEALVYAANVHARASDNPIPRHPKPEWLPEPWAGNLSGESPTPIYE
jgi:hypothetical protein